jgi:hypothetical protein
MKKKKKKSPEEKGKKFFSLTRSIFHSRSGGQSHDGMTPTKKKKEKKKEVRDPPATHSTWPHTLRHLITSTERGPPWKWMDVHGYTHISRQTTFLFFFPFLKIQPISWGEGGRVHQKGNYWTCSGSKKIRQETPFVLFRVHRVFVCVKAVGILLRENLATNSSSPSSSPRATWQQPNVVDICKRLYNLTTTTTATKNESRSRSVDSQSQSIQRIK